MRQLSALDDIFVQLESPRSPMHISSFMIYDQTTAPGGKVTFTGILKEMEQRLHLARSFRERLVHVPFGADHPWWLRDPDFDLEFHVRHIALPHPGDWRQLCIQLARLHSRSLDMKRPPWEFTVIEGLDAVEGVPPGSFAVVQKLHHCAVDGISGVEITNVVHDVEPDSQRTPAAQPWQPEDNPSPAELLLRSAVNAVRRPIRAGQLTGGALPSVLRRVPDIVRSLPNNLVSLPGSLEAPRTRFNAHITAHRVVDATSFALRDLQQIRSAVPGASVNDVALAIVGGGLRRYLLAKGELPTASLVAGVPVSVRAPDQVKAGGNLISGITAPLGTDFEDPIERVAAINDVTKNALGSARGVKAELLREVSEALPGALLGLGLRTMLTHAASQILPYNTIVTNVPGPRVPLYFCGAQMVRMLGGGPLFDGMALIHAVGSYVDDFNITFAACREVMPDPAFYTACLRESVSELLEASASVVHDESHP